LASLSGSRRVLMKFCLRLRHFRHFNGVLGVSLILKERP
jgi:hypothetical protein